MKNKGIFLKVVILVFICVVQYVLALLCILLFPGLGGTILKLATSPNLLAAHLKTLLAFSFGIFTSGSLGLLLLRRKVKHAWIQRLIWTVVLIALPLAIALIPGVNSNGLFYFIAILGGILGFYMPEWIRKGA